VAASATARRQTPSLLLSGSPGRRGASRSPGGNSREIEGLFYVPAAAVAASCNGRASACRPGAFCYWKDGGRERHLRIARKRR